MKVKLPGLLCALFIFYAEGFIACKKGNTQAAPSNLTLITLTVNGSSTGFIYKNVNFTPVIKLTFSEALNPASLTVGLSFKNNAGSDVGFTSALSDNNNTITIQPSAALSALTQYSVVASTAIQSQSRGALSSSITIHLTTSIDSTRKFPLLSDSALLTLVEQQSFKYFYNFGHPVSGLARERNTSDDIVTTGGSGFGAMAILVGIQRNFISRGEGLTRLGLIVNFLTSQAHRYHGAFPHWMNGATGETVPFSAQDDGADLVETSYLIEGLLCARQFFNSAGDPDEISLRSKINNLYSAVEWNWFRQNGQSVLYWHWSPDNYFAINQPVSGWNEALIVYALAASSAVDSNRIPKIVYDSGWAMNGAIKNGNSYYGVQLPLGPAGGGPLFFAHYSFLAINPTGLADAYANYWTQNSAHTQINYNYCVANPEGYNGYSNQCWGLTASDDNISGYSAHSPTNDLGVISPTAAISSLPYSPAESMAALKFFYYILGDHLWGDYGFVDAFNLTDPWFATSYLAIDQGPEIAMIENYRSGLLWNLFMSCPEIKTGMKSLGFQSTQLN